MNRPKTHCASAIQVGRSYVQLFSRCYFLEWLIFCTYIQSIRHTAFINRKDAYETRLARKTNTQGLLLQNKLLFTAILGKQLHVSQTRRLTFAHKLQVGIDSHWRRSSRWKHIRRNQRQGRHGLKKKLDKMDRNTNIKDSSELITGNYTESALLEGNGYSC